MAGCEAMSDAVAGSLGGGVATSLLYPLDTLRSKLASQTSDTGEHRGARQTIRAVLAKEGIGGFYPGLRFKISKSMFGKLIYFFAYSYLKTEYAAKVGPLTPGVNLAIGYASEWLHMPMTMPCDVITTRLQTGAAKGGLFAVISSLYKEGGMASFYKGLSAHPLVSLQPAIQFTVYDLLKRRLLHGHKALLAWQGFLLGAMSRAIAIAIIFPFLRAKTVLQTRNKSKPTAAVKQEGIFTVLAGLIRTRGVTSLYSGLSTELTRAVLVSAIGMALKERIYVVTSLFFKQLFAGATKPVVQEVVKVATKL